MPHELPVPGLIFVFFIALALWNELSVWIALCCGIILFDRNFAYTHIQFGPLPIYISEFVLFLLILRRCLSAPSTWTALWQRSSRQTVHAWLVFFALGLYSFGRGLYTYDPLTTLRDFALCYYSLYFLLAASMDWSDDKRRIFLRCLFAAAIIRAVMICALKLFDSADFPAGILGQPAAMSMAMALALLVILCIYSFELPWPILLASIVITASILLLRVRSSWTGLLAAGAVVLWLSARNESPRTLAWKVLKTLAVLGIGSTLLLAVFDLPQTAPVSSRLSTLWPISESVPRIHQPASGSEPPLLDQTQSTKPEVPFAIDTHQAPLKAVGIELRSFFKGRASNNVMTRVWMWRDAFMELFSFGLFSDKLSVSMLKQYNLGPLMETAPGTFVMSICAAGFENQQVVFHTQTSPGTSHWQSTFGHLHRILFGIPFGKMFLPPEVVWVVNSPNRYDPHNSLLAITYRLGLLGIVAFFWLIVTVQRGFLAAWPGTLPARRYFWLAVQASLIYFLIHSLTDNTLENAFKGLWFWLLLGLHWRLRRETCGS